MGAVLLIGAFDEKVFTSGQAGFSGKWLDQIVALFPGFVSLTIESIESAIGIVLKKENDTQPAKKLNVNFFQQTQAGVLVRFSIEEELDVCSGDVRKRAWGQLKKAGLIQDNQFSPLCCIFTTEQIETILTGKPDPNSLAGELEQMQQYNDWLGIYNRLGAIEKINQAFPDVWEDAGILSTIGFACGKLAETSEIPSNIFRDEHRKREFLKQQEQYRHETELLRKRCVELMPNNAAYWSNLAYFHYLNAIELNAPRGRRDGRIREEIESALDCFDKALLLDSTRIKEHYRKGYLLAEVMPQPALYGKQWSDIGNRWEFVRRKVHEGIQSFLQAIQLWEALNENDEEQSKQRKRTRKEYIKSLYHTGCAFYSLIFKDWEEAVYVLDLRKDISAKDNITYIPDDLQNANQAWHYFYRCWSVDRSSDRILDEPSANTTPSDGIEEGVYKLYWLGKISFARYWILSGYGQFDTPQAIENRDKAENYLLAALNFAWSSEKQRQKKDFVVELLGRVYVSRGEYERATEIIQKYCGDRLDAYVAHTFATALLLLGNYEQAKKVLAEAINNRGNKAIWTTYFLQGCSYLHEGNLEEAQEAFKQADDEARKKGKETLDTLLIGQAFIAYKSNNRQEAIEYLKQAVGINPYRISAQRRLQNWQNDSSEQNN